MKSLIIVTLVAAVFSAHSIAATDHDAHGGHGAMPVQKIDKPAGKVTASQGGQPNSKINASRSGPASSNGHAHEHTDAK